MLLIFLKGILLGVAITAPVGPINILCIRRSLRNGFKAGVLTGFGAALADTFFGAVAAFSLTQVSEFLKAYQNPLQLLGAVVFLAMGFNLLRSQKPPTEIPEVTVLSSWLAFTSGLLLTIHNPATILAFFVAFTAVNIGHDLTLWGSSLATLGVFIGAMSWWLILSGTATKLRSRIRGQHIHRMNQITGVVLVFSSLGLFYSALV